jgi:uncharacterized membrane protein
MKEILTSEICEKLAQLISEQEQFTEGEIKIHIDPICLGDPLAKASEVFKKLNLHKTNNGSGILIYLSEKDHKIAVYADYGIYQAVGKNSVWDEVIQVMIQKLRHKLFEEALTLGILKCGKILKKYYPATKNNVNEISNEISFG